MSEEDGGNIRVICRFRPQNEKEQRFSEEVVAQFPPDNKTVMMSVSDSSQPYNFGFDYVFNPTATQEQVYQIAACPIVNSVMQGFNGTVFAYGQTSSGKTFTMTGPSIDDPVYCGIIPRMVNTVFEGISSADSTIEFTVKVGYCEIYLEKIKDLLNPVKNNLQVKEDRNRGVYIADLTEEYVSCMEEVYDLMRIGTSNREVGYTHMNAGSSRSHSIFIITIAQNNTTDYSAKAGKLYLVDLAGSEKVGKTGAEGKRLDEAKNINKSLSALGNVINALTDGKSTHVPYRDSKLTRVLQDSLGGNSKTALIITCSPSVYNEQETLSTLRFGIRAKSIKNKPKVNREYTIAELKLLLTKAQEQLGVKEQIIQQLRKNIIESGGSVPRIDSEEVKEGTQSDEQNEELIQELRERLTDEEDKNIALREELEQLRAEIMNMFNENSRLQTELSDAQSDLYEKYKAITEQDEIIVTLNLKNEALQAELMSYSENTLKLEKQLGEKNEEMDNLRDKISRPTFDQEKADLQTELHNTQERYIQAENQLNEIRHELATALTEIGSKRSEMASIQNNIHEQSLRQERERWHKEKARLLTEIQSKNDKIMAMDLALSERDQNYNSLQSALSIGERALKKKCDHLERNLEQLTLMYHQLVSQQSAMNVDKKVHEKKLTRLLQQKTEMTEKIRKMSKDLARKENDIQQLRTELEISQCTRMTLGPNNRVRKPMRGGYRTSGYRPKITSLAFNFPE